MKMPSRALQNRAQMLFSLALTQAPSAGLWMVLLMTGPAPVPAGQSAKRQAAHLANFQRLSNEGRLALVGPTMQPKSDLRGILLVQAAGRQQVIEEFRADPYVEHQNLALKVYEFFPMRGSFVTKRTDAKMTPVRLVWLEKNPLTPLPGTQDWSRVLTNQISFYNRAECPFRLAGSLGEDAEGGVIHILDTTDDAKAMAASYRLPLVSSGMMKPRITPLFLAEGGMPKMP